MKEELLKCLIEEQLEAVSGGCGTQRPFPPCPKCGSTIISAPYMVVIGSILASIASHHTIGVKKHSKALFKNASLTHIEIRYGI